MKSDRVYLSHMGDELAFRMKATQGVTFEAFIRDEVLKRAVTRSIEILGEASKNVSPEIKKRHRDIDWKSIAGMRDKVIHFYFGVNWDFVWDVAVSKSPLLKRAIETILEAEDT